MNNELCERILKENEFVKTLINTIPPYYYFDAETSQKITSTQHQRLHETLNRLGGRTTRKPSKLTAKNKHKRLKLDPKNKKTVTELQEEFDSGNEANTEESDVAKGRLGFGNAIPANRANLLERLHEKIELCRGNRNNSEEWLQQRREKRQKRQLAKKEKKTKQPANMNGKKVGEKKKKLKFETESANAEKLIYNKDKKMVFSKLDFSDCGEPEKKKMKGAPMGKDYKQLLEKAKKKKTKLKELKEKDPEKAKLVEEKEGWLRAIQKAEGIKIKDNPEMLKKALKTKEKRQKRSKQKWDERQKNVEDNLQKRQNKRQENIKAKKQEKVKKKIKKAMKKGRYIPPTTA